MARTSDEPDFGEVKGLLRRLETTSQSGGPGASNQSYAQFPGEPPRPVRVQQGPSSAATLFLIANTMMTTATMTSIAWYLFHSSEMQRNKPGSAGDVPPGAIAWPPRDNAAPAPGSIPAAAKPAPAPVARLVGPATFEIKTGTAARISLELQPREIVAEADHISVRGLPNDVTFNHGVRSGPTSWTVPIAELTDLELVAGPNVPASRDELAFLAMSKDDRPLASAATTLIVSGPPVEAPPAPPVPPAPVDAATQAKHVAKAREYLSIGQVGAARLVLQRAADSGSAEAALMLGDTYDPVRLFQLGARGLVGDLDKATFWYEKADELGSPEAKARIVGLAQK